MGSEKNLFFDRQQLWGMAAAKDVSCGLCGAVVFLVHTTLTQRRLVQITMPLILRLFTHPLLLFASPLNPCTTPTNAVLDLAGATWSLACAPFCSWRRRSSTRIPTESVPAPGPTLPPAAHASSWASRRPREARRVRSRSTQSTPTSLPPPHTRWVDGGGEWRGIAPVPRPQLSTRRLPGYRRPFALSHPRVHHC